MKPIKPLTLRELCLLLRDIIESDTEIHLLVTKEGTIHVIKAAAFAFGGMTGSEAEEVDEDKPVITLNADTLRRLAARKEKKEKAEDYYG